MRIRTVDRLNYYATETLGKTRRITPEGFLLCEGVAIARTGTQLYAANELPITAGTDGLIRIERVDEEVFRPETIASFEGKPVTVEHPNEFVSPDNWSQLTVGITQNVRRGEGIQADLLLADLLITSADAIAYVNNELPELSAGYEAEYEETRPGYGRQKNIIGNHVALVTRGRAGPRCAIKDEEIPMPAKKRSWWDRIATAVKAQDADAVKAELESEDSEIEEGEEKAKTSDSANNAAIAKLQKTVDGLVSAVAKLTKDAEEEEKKKTDDADEEEEETNDTVIEAETAQKANTGTTLTGDALKEIVARAEILSPGIQMPTGDAANAPAAAETLMRNALEKANTNDVGKACISPFLMSRELKVLTGDALLGVFNGAAELMRLRNNQQSERQSVATKDFGKPKSVADMNAQHRAFWANK